MQLLSTVRSPGRGLARCLFLVAIGSGLASAQTWPWFGEPYTVRLLAEAPGANPLDGEMAVGADALRITWFQRGFAYTTLFRLRSADIVVWSLSPDETYTERVYLPQELPEIAIQGFVAPGTHPTNALHPCSALPERYRCSLEGSEPLGGATTERWRMEAEGETGAVYGQTFWFDPALGMVVLARSDTGTILIFHDYRPGPVDPALFEVPPEYELVLPDP